ncbi:MAG: cation:proton antiporter, partial [Gemmatimonadetes bacterium]|nr:cation:proton antiporter [Gemmatimonadota bacterium]
MRHGSRSRPPGRLLRWILLAAALLVLGAGDRDAGPAPGAAIAAARGQHATEAAARAPEPQPPSEHPEPVRPARFFLVLIAVLVAGKLGGEVAERFRQPAVLGELVAGMVVGGSVLGIVPTGLGDPMAEILRTLAEIGVVLLLFEIGLETDLKAMFRVGVPALTVASVGVACPFLLGFLYWYFADPALGAHPPGVTLASVAIFVGATLTATSVGITARVLSDLGQLHTPEARTIIGAAVIDDVLGLVILAMVTGLVAGGTFTVPGLVWTLVKASGFLVAAVVIGNFIGPHLFDFIDRLRVRGVLWVSAFSFALLLSALADLADSARIIGAFAAGIILSSTNQFDLVVEQV